MRTDQTVAEMVEEVLLRQAKTRAERTGEPLAEAFEAVLETEAGRQLRELGGGPHCYKGSQQWQESLARERAEARAEALGWSSTDELPYSPADDQRRGPR